MCQLPCHLKVNREEILFAVRGTELYMEQLWLRFVSHNPAMSMH